MTTPPWSSSKSAGPRTSSRTRRTSSITSRRHARRAALAGRRPPAWRRGRPLRRRAASKDVRGTLTKSCVVGAYERVAYCRERRVSSVSGTKGVLELDGRVGDKPARPSRFLRVRLACNNIRGFAAAAAQARADELVSHRRFCTITASSRDEPFVVCKKWLLQTSPRCAYGCVRVASRILRRRRGET